MDDRLWVNPGGLRVRGRGEDGGYWEEDGDGSVFDFQAAEDQCGVDEARENVKQSIEDRIKDRNEGYEYLNRRIDEMVEEMRGNFCDMASPPAEPRPTLLARSWSLLKGAAKPVPCISVWAGLMGTYFWNVSNSMPDQPFEGILDLPEEFPGKLCASLGATAVFAIWTWCFKSTIREAIRREFAESK